MEEIIPRYDLPTLFGSDNGYKLISQVISLQYRAWELIGSYTLPIDHNIQVR